MYQSCILEEGTYETFYILGISTLVSPFESHIQWAFY